MNISRRLQIIALLVLVIGSCDSGGSEQGPPGSCKTGGTATGNYDPGCTQCAKAKCDAELREKSGSGWANQYFGGDGACASFNGCICDCLKSGMDVLVCSTTACLAKLDEACQNAVLAAHKCLRDRCPDACP